MRAPLLGTILLLVPACGGRQVSVSSEVVTTVVQPKVDQAPALTQEERARLHDLPFPIGAVPVKLHGERGALVLSYNSLLSAVQLQTFYHKGMDYSGWEELGALMAQESCHIYSKPSKLCTITFGPHEGATRVLIFIIPKK